MRNNNITSVSGKCTAVGMQLNQCPWGGIGEYMEINWISVGE